MQPLADFLRTSLAERYAAPVMRVDADGVVRLLPGKALEFARERARSAGFADVEEQVAELDVRRLPWHEAPAAGMRLWRQHGFAGAEGELVTEIVAGDPGYQVVTVLDEWSLVRLLDGAMGWAAPGEAPGGATVEAPSGGDWRVLRPGELVEVAQGFLDVPYRWGGTTSAGVDCSGLVQRSAWTAASCWLPRHSRALLKVGERGSQRALERGDVLVLQRRPGVPSSTGDGFPAEHDGPAVHPMHVAIALDARELLHASRDAWRVVVEPYEDVRARYKVLSVRRFGVGGD